MQHTVLLAYISRRIYNVRPDQTYAIWQHPTHCRIRMDTADHACCVSWDRTSYFRTSQIAAFRWPAKPDAAWQHLWGSSKGPANCILAKIISTDLPDPPWTPKQSCWLTRFWLAVDGLGTSRNPDIKSSPCFFFFFLARRKLKEIVLQQKSSYLCRCWEEETRKNQLLWTGSLRNYFFSIKKVQGVVLA